MRYLTQPLDMDPRFQAICGLPQPFVTYDVARVCGISFTTARRLLVELRERLSEEPELDQLVAKRGLPQYGGGHRFVPGDLDD